ncbi:MAG: S-layer homology domain-containing protein [Candidatus Cohnella colombiensis]|uniref:S-layer homology domain-containing protein n=1 Tax=Candidatus Cohnella colombiensis TaxID=3121368 RepID=A0AA95JFC2_9BACL|nr:MAG: S-layer homology domain-containing protein [Cohnella sp.]
MKALKKSLISIVVSLSLVMSSMLSALPVATVSAAMSGSNSAENPPQAIVGKTDVATWSYTSAADVTTANGNFAATSGYYKTAPDTTNSTLQLFINNAQKTTGFSYSTSSISNSGFNGQTDKGYWLIKTSTAGYKDLVLNFSARSSGTGPRDFNTEWSTDGTNWTVFGNTVVGTGYTVKIESTALEQFGMVLPAGAEYQNTLYIRIVQKSEFQESGTGNVAAGGTSNINNIQLYGTKDPALTTPAVTATPDAAGAILDITPITLSNTDSTAQIFYTTDGTTPATTAGGSTKLYTAPFTALSEGGFTGTNPFVVKAVAKSPTLLSTDVVTLSFNQQTITSNADAKKLDAGTYAWVKGIGTYSTAANTLYIQDGMNAGSGLMIFKSGADISSYAGKEIYVYGKATLYNGLMEIVPDDVTTNIVVRNTNPTLPTPTKIMFSQLADRTYEGMLVSFDTVKLDTVAGTNTGSLYNHTVSQAGIQTTLRSNGIASAVGVSGSYVNITRSIASYFNGVQLLSSNAADLVATTAPTVEFINASVPVGTAVPLNSKVTLATTTSGATITYSLNGNAPITSTTNSVDVTVDAFQNGTATITANASDGSYTTATQTFTFKQIKAENVIASPGSSAIPTTTAITLSSATAGSSVVYSVYKNSYSSTDGTLVGTADQTYTAPITLDASDFPVRIVAKATLVNYLDSDPSTFTYTAKKATGGEKNYYGSLHAHTLNSDGQGTLAEAYTYARDQGKFDFFIVTDHSNSFDSATYDVTSNRNINSYNGANAAWLAGKKAATDAATPTYVTDYGYEMTWSGGPGHMNTFNTTGFVSRNNSTLNNKTNDTGLQTYYQMLESTPGSISQLNHPGATFGNFANFGYHDNAIDDKVTLVEAGNGEGAVGSGGYFRSVDQFILALDKGWHVAPTNNGDNHKKGWGTSNTAATVVYTNDFTLSGIYQALHERSVWSTENRDLDVTYHLNNGTDNYSMGAILNAPPATANILVTATNKNPGTATSNIASVQLISSGGKIVNKQTYPVGTSNVNYTYSMTAPSAGYYFAIVTDNQGFVAVTAPIWLGSAPKVGINSVSNSSVMPVTTEALNLTTDFFNSESAPVTLKSISYTVDGDSTANKTYTPGINIASSGVATHVFSYTPTTSGTKTVTISAVITVNGDDKTFTTTSTMKVVDVNSVLYVGLDASHGNEYVSGGSYPNSMSNMMTLAGSNSVRVVQLNTSSELIAATSNPKYKMIILNAPSRKNVPAWPTPANYTTAEIAALKVFAENGNTLVFGSIADFGESTNADPASPKKHMSELQNDVLAAIGSTLREGDDQVMDDDINGGQPYRLYPTEFNMANPLLQGVVEGQVYSQYSGSTIYAVDPTTGVRTSTLPTTVSPLVYSFPTTYSSESDNDNFGYGSSMATFPYVTVGTYKTDKGISNSQGLYIPKYVNPNSKVATNPEEKLLAASETVTHSNGKTSLVVVAGGVFMSNFEIQVSLDNAGTLPYANYNLMDNLYKLVNPIKITSIDDAKNLPDGTDVIIEATTTSEVNTQVTNPSTNKGFFDSIYAQDATGGINLFPVASGIQEGQKARFEGKIGHYQGEVQLNVSKFTVLDSAIHKLAPTALTSTAMLSANTGLLVKTEGVVSNIYKETDGTINQFTIDDGSGLAIVFINGYITSGTTLPFIMDGARVSVVGLASIGEVVSDSDMHPRIRVRDRSEIVSVSLAVDKTALNTAITGAQTLLGSKTVGVANGNVTQAGHDALQNAITAATAVKSDANATKAQVDAQVNALATATITFNNAIISNNNSGNNNNGNNNNGNNSNNNNGNNSNNSNSGGGDSTTTTPPATPNTLPTVPTLTQPILSTALLVDAQALQQNIIDVLHQNATQPVVFQDVPATSWSAKAVNMAAQLGIVTGKPDGNFHGDDNVTRAEFALMIVRALGLDTSNAISNGTFSDTKGHWAEAAIDVLKQAGIIKGVGDGSFKPNQQITRAEISAILARVMQMVPASTSSFSDTSSSWASQYIEQLHNAGIVTGTGNNQFQPNAHATRDQSVAMILRMLNKTLNLGLDV